MTDIHWLNAVSANFDTAVDWSSGSVPGSGDAAILDAAGAAFTVSSYADQTVNAVRTASNATLAIDSGTFTIAKSVPAMTNAGTIAIGAHAKLVTAGTLMNTGAVSVFGRGASLVIDHALTLEGGGTVSVGGRAEPIRAKGATAVLINVDDTITGAGSMGGALHHIGFKLVNETDGVIKTSTGQGLLIVAHAPSINTGTIEAIGGGLGVQVSVLRNHGGTIHATDGGGVTLSGGILIGGRLSVAGSGSQVVVSNSESIRGTIISTTAGAEILVDAFATLTTHGDITNSGLIEINSTGNPGSPPALVLSKSSRLTGGGDVLLSDAAIETTPGTATFTNVDNTIVGGGMIGGAGLAMRNMAGGVIESDQSNVVLTLDARSITNAGLIETTLHSSLAVDSAIFNTGTIEAGDGGEITFGEAVTGHGKFRLFDGAFDFASSFEGNVYFQRRSTNVLALHESQSYAGSLLEFSSTGRSTLDLADIGFVGTNEATYSGTTSGGTLTVTDGTHTARISLVGDYLTSTFTASSDETGGTDVVAASPQSQSAVHRFIALSAAFGAGSAAEASRSDVHGKDNSPRLARPATS